MIRIEIANRQAAVAVDRRQLRRAVRIVLEEESISEARVGIAVVDDAAIRELNRRYLAHDEATDVLSFVLERSRRGVEGEIVVSGQTACRVAQEYRWTAAQELFLYVIHGALHLAGWTDETPEKRSAMARRERACLAHFGLKPRYRKSAAPCRPKKRLPSSSG